MYATLAKEHVNHLSFVLVVVHVRLFGLSELNYFSFGKRNRWEYAVRDLFHVDDLPSDDENSSKQISRLRDQVKGMATLIVIISNMSLNSIIYLGPSFVRTTT